MVTAAAAVPPPPAARRALDQLQHQLEHEPQVALPGLTGPVKLLAMEQQPAQMVTVAFTLPNLGKGVAASPSEEATVLGMLQQLLPPGSMVRAARAEQGADGPAAVINADVPVPYLERAREAQQLFAEAAAVDGHVDMAALANLRNAGAAVRALVANSEALEHAAAGGRSALCLTLMMPAEVHQADLLTALSKRLPGG